jgi:hypothetical protein
MAHFDNFPEHVIYICKFFGITVLAITRQSSLSCLAIKKEFQL